MGKDRSIKKLSVIALIVSILGLSIVFAILSVSLNMTGVAKLSKGGLDIVFEKIPGVKVSKADGVILTYDEPTITDSGRTLNLGNITFNDKEDYYQYSINVVNKSQYYTKITSINIPNITSEAYQYLDFSIKYENGISVAVDDVYAPSQIKKAVIRIAFRKGMTDEEFDEIPDNFVCNLNDIAATFEKTDGEIVSPEKDMTNAGTLAANVVAQDLSSIKLYGENSPLTFDLIGSASGYRVTFMDKNEPYEYATDSFDGSEEQNKSVTVSYVLSQDNFYDIYIGSEGGVYAPSNSSFLFIGASAITNLDYLDTSKATDMSAMFLSTSINSLDLSSFDTSKVTDMKWMFQESKTLSSITFGDKFDTTNVTDMQNMFESNSSLTSLDLSGFNTSKVENFSSMFMGCTSLESLDIRNATFDSVTSNDAFQSIFYRIPNNTLITVKTASIKATIEQLYSNLSNVVVASS